MELAKANPEAAIELLRKQRQEEKESEPASFNRKKEVKTQNARYVWVS